MTINLQGNIHMPSNKWYLTKPISINTLTNWKMKTDKDNGKIDKPGLLDQAC